MVDWLVYLVVTVVAGGLAAFVIAMFKVGPGKPDFSFGRALALCLLASGTGPFLYVEALTRAKLPTLGPTVRKWYAQDNSITGKLVSTKILSCTGDRATALLIGQEKESWGGHDRPVVKLSLVRKGTTWRVEGAKVLRSVRLGRDEMVFPPYQ